MSNNCRENPQINTLLIQPPFHKDDRRRPPIQLMMMGTLANMEYPTKVIDGQSTGISVNDLAEHVASFRPDIAGISILSPTFPASVELAKAIKSLRPEVVMIAGGKHATIDTPQTLATEAFDIVVRGEGEDRLLTIIHGYLQSGKDIHTLQQLLTNEKGITYPGDPNPLTLSSAVEIKGLPLINWDILVPNLEYYLGHTASVEDSRGCVHDCSYCSASLYRTKVSFQEPLHVTQEVENLCKRGFTSFFFNGDDCFISPRRSIEILESVATIRLPLTLALNVRADSFMRCFRKYGDRFLQALTNAHVITLHIGIESGDSDILHIVNKKLSMEDVYETIRIANELGIVVETNWIVGLPDDSEKSIANSLALALKLRDVAGPHFPHLSYFMPYPGTLDAKRAVESGLYDPNTFDLSRLAAHHEPILTTKHLSKDRIAVLYHKFLSTFYSDTYATSLPEGPLRNKVQKMHDILINEKKKD